MPGLELRLALRSLTEESSTSVSGADVGETISALLPLVNAKQDSSFLDAMVRKHRDTLQKLNVYVDHLGKHRPMTGSEGSNGKRTGRCDQASSHSSGWPRRDRVPDCA